MHQVNIREARAHLSKLAQEAIAGEYVIIQPLKTAKS